MIAFLDDRETRFRFYAPYTNREFFETKEGDMNNLTMKDPIAILKESKDKWDWHNPHPTKQVDEYNEWRRQNRNVKMCFNTENLRGLNLSYANFREASLPGADFSYCELVETDFVRSDLQRSKFIEANLYGALLDQADLSNADLRNSTLWWTTLVETKLKGADISNSRVYGVSPWRVDLEGTIQNDLNISRHDEEKLTVDDLEVAHFTYLLINNQKLRNVINTITTKSVLILGRFKSERKQILDALKNALRKRNYLPMLFDFKPSVKRDLTETVQLMANLAKFVIADITEAKSIPQELSHIIPMLPSVPVQPILLGSDIGYEMFDHWRGFKSVLPVFKYKNEQDLLSRLDSELITSIDAWEKKQDEVSALREKIRELEAKLTLQK